MEATSPVQAPRHLRVFVYGTLKRGEKNFAAHCASAVTITEGWLWGRLFHRHTGTPILSLPIESILAVGSDDAHHDVRLQEEASGWGTADFSDDFHWVRVRGEVMEFADIADALARLDHLEDYRPTDEDSLYERFLVRLGDRPDLTVWTFAIPRSGRESDYTPAPDPTRWTRGW